MANTFFPNAGHFYSSRVMPVMVDCNFSVLQSNSLGITGLSGKKVLNVFMNTSTTPGVGNGNITNPDPADGNIVVQLVDNYYSILAFDFAIQSPASGSDIKIDNSAMTAGAAYVITTLGNATAAKWLAIGVPAGITPAVGVSFIAASNGGAGNTLTSRVQIAAATGSAVAAMEFIGNPNVMNAPLASANQGYGASFILQCRDYAGALVAPVDGSKISLKFYLSNSSV